MSGKQSFGALARATRLGKGVSLRALADALGWTPVYISDIERGRRNPPKGDKARCWAKVLEANPDQFMRAAMPAEVATLIEALEWYANLLHYRTYYSAVDGNWWSDAMKDGGERARDALKTMEATE